MQTAPVPRRKVRNWKDVQLIVSSISVAVTLGLWSLWASREKPAPPVVVDTLEPSEPTVTATATEPLMLPGQVIYLGAATPQAAAPVANQTNLDQPRHPKGRGGGRGGGGGGGGGANASTGSS
jgi:hypothetical protein